MFVVYQNNKKARYPECEDVHPSWENCEFETFEEAEAYARNWLGMYAPPEGTLVVNVPFVFFGCEFGNETVTIKEE